MKLQLNIAPRFPPREPRNATNVSTRLFLPDGRELRIVIKNITPRGFMAVAQSPIGEPCEMGVELPAFGIVRARVRWIEGTNFGASFIGELPRTALVKFSRCSVRQH